MNNVEIFYKRRALLQTVKEGIKHREICYTSNEGDYVRVYFNADLKGMLNAEDSRAILDIVKEEITGSMAKVGKEVIRQLTADMEYGRGKVLKDFKMIGDLKNDNNE